MDDLPDTRTMLEAELMLCQGLLLCRTEDDDDPYRLTSEERRILWAHCLNVKDRLRRMARSERM